MRRIGWLTLAVVAHAMMAGMGCSGDPADDGAGAEAPARTATASQLRAFDGLEALTQKHWVWVQHEGLRTPLHLSTSRSGAAVLARGADPVKATVSLLDTHKKLFRMRDPAVELRARRTSTDAYGNTHARLEQLTHGIPVAGAEVSAHYDADGHVASIDANYVADLDDVDVDPAFTAEEGLAKVKASLGGELLGEARLVVYAPATVDPAAAAIPARLAYQYRIDALDADAPAIWVVMLDAKTGTILHRYNDLQTVDGQGVGVMGDAKKLQVSGSGTDFTLVDSSSAVPIRTYTAEQQTQFTILPGELIRSTSATSWDTGVTGAGAAVDAHFNAAIVLKYYKDKFQRNAIDGAGGALVSTVHFGRNYDNAAWNGTGMVYGDGGTMFRALSVGVDVVAHEFTHGVTDRETGLVYENQPGALNEAISDVFAAFIEHAVAPNDTNNWNIGEQLIKQGSVLRNMKTPSQVDQPQPSHMNQFVNTQIDAGGVHINSGIINNAAFLMTVGGTNPGSKVEVKYGIGWEKSEKLWYHAVTAYFMSTTNFAQAAQALLQAAKDIKLTPNETAIVECAFKAVGLSTGVCAAIGDPKLTTTPGPIPGANTATGDATAGDDEEDAPKTATSTSKTRRRRIVTESEGCSAAPRSSGGDAGGLLVVALGALVALGRKARRIR